MTPVNQHKAKDLEEAYAITVLLGKLNPGEAISFAIQRDGTYLVYVGLPQMENNDVGTTST